MHVFLNEEGLNLKTDSGLIINNITSFVDYRGDSYNTLTVSSEKWQVTKTESGFTACDGKFAIFFSETENGLFIRGEYKGDIDIKKARKFCFFKGKVKKEFNRAYINGYTECNGVKTDNMQVSVGVTGLIKNQRVESADFVVGICGDESCLTVGAAEYKENYAMIELTSCGEVACIVDLYDNRVKNGETIRSDRFIVAESKNLQTALKLYARCVTDNNRGELCLNAEPQSGWCSWYYYGPDISEEIILENAKLLKERNIPVDYVQIDDGWFDYRGDWNANDKFPHGMKYIADEIKKTGFKPGIWITPLTADDSSVLFKNNPDIFVKERDSDKIFGTNSIDFSTEKAQKYLYDLLHKLSYDYGFRYVKFDFVGFGISCGRYSDPSFNAVKNYRKALEIMKSAVTKDTFLLACTSPVISPVGLTDGLRISVDIFERWESVKHIASQIFERMYLSEGIAVDPDCVLMRTRLNEDSQCFRKCVRTEKEIETLISVIGVSGGSVFLSDKISLLSDSQVEKFKCLLPVNRQCGIPVDQTERAIPCIIDCGERNGIKTVALFNFEDFNQKIYYSLDRSYRVYDFWERKYLGLKTELSFNLEPHCCKILQCSVPDDISLLGSEGRLIPDMILRVKGDNAKITGTKSDEKIIIYSEKAVSGRNCGVKKTDDCIWQITALSENPEISFR